MERKHPRWPWSRCGVEVKLEKGSAQEESPENGGGQLQPLADWGQLPCGHGVGACLVWWKRMRGMGRHSGGCVLRTGCELSHFRIASNLEWLVSTRTWPPSLTTQSGPLPNFLLATRRHLPCRALQSLTCSYFSRSLSGIMSGTSDKKGTPSVSSFSRCPGV